MRPTEHQELDEASGPKVNLNAAHHAVVPAPQVPKMTRAEQRKALRDLGLSSTKIRSMDATRILGEDMQREGLFQYASGELIHTNLRRDDLIQKCCINLSKDSLQPGEFAVYAKALNDALNGKNKGLKQMIELAQKNGWKDPKPTRPDGAPPKRVPIVAINTTGNVEVREGSG
jgi:hypothetical protein